MGEGNRFMQKILIVDDSEMNRDILAEMLGEEYEIIEAENGEKAVAVLQKHSAEISLVLLDIVMPVMDGYEVLAVMNSNHWIEDVPVIMISSETSPAMIDRAFELGVADFISRPFDALIVRRRVINTILLYAKQKKLESLVTEQIYEKEKTSSLMIAILSHIVEFRNGESGLHVLHVQAYTETMLRRLIQITDKYKITNHDITLISNASALHDIGKISISDEILNKPGKLTKEEFEIMKTHSSVGASMLSELSVYQNEPLVKIAYEICRWHHERYDGRGYPDGLSGDEIPISAQVVALADVYDALTSERVYKKAFSHEVAVNMIRNGECGSFNPLILKCFQDVAEEIERKSKSDTTDQNREREIKSVTDEMLRHRELSSSERTLNLLLHERMKNHFFSATTDEILFEFTNTPAMVTFSAHGAQKLGIPEYIMNPLENGELLSVMRKEDIQALSGLLQSTTPESPMVQYDCAVNYKGNVQKTHIICQSVWSSDEQPVFAGAVGKFVYGEAAGDIPMPEAISFQDTLTGLMNLDYSRKLIQRILTNRKEENYVLAVLDIDGLDAVNQKFGHESGDHLLMHMAEKVRRCIRRGDIAARAGGDEILIFMECGDEMEKVIQRVFSALEREKQSCPVSFCMGAAKTEESGEDYDCLLQKANQALSAAKSSGKGRIRYYDGSMKEIQSELTPIDKVNYPEEE